MRYEFDRLGWLNFEWLVQTWLKAEFGFTVESWGGNRDQGRDAYSKSTVSSRSTKSEYPGPVVFQAKFVEQANATGSGYKSPLIKACVAEAKAVQHRVNQGVWTRPKSYVLLTNCPVTAADRTDAARALASDDSGCVTVLGAGDLSDAIDLRPEIARAYPQILSYRNLVEIIQQSQAKEVLERSAAAIEAAKDILPVFVPTDAYDRAWSILKQKYFVVLSGPPEMGKTSIGWMIAMSQVANGWQVIECPTPGDVFKVYDSKAQQLFLADDAFGRTEFRPSQGALWEPDLGKVLLRTNKDHLLVWTSRKHILERAMREMDLPGGKEKFPTPGEVLVQADKLSTKEKALILYRHAVAANLEESAKNILKGNLETVVSNPHFTPERIRRFVRVELPRLDSELRKGALNTDSVQASIEKAIEQCTEMMEKSFLKLPDEQKWILVCLLDEGTTNTPDKVELNFAKISPVQGSRPFAVLLDELNEAFIRISESGFLRPIRATIKTIGWIHPSYRDLVIESLCKNRAMRHHYLEKGGTPAIALALSQEGGAAGQRTFPLMLDDESWDLLEKNCVSQLNAEDQTHDGAILEIINSAISGSPQYLQKLESLATVICETLRQKWNRNGIAITNNELEQYYKLAERAKQFVSSPDLSSTWDCAWEPIREVIYDASTRVFGPPEELTEWTSLCQLIQENEPRFLRRTGFSTVSAEVAKRIAAIAKNDGNDEPSYDDAEEYRSEAERLNEIHSALESLRDTFPNCADELADALDVLETHVSELEEQASTIEKPEREWEDDDRRPGIEVFDLHELFSDL